MQSLCRRFAPVVIAISHVEDDDGVTFTGVDLDSGAPTVVSLAHSAVDTSARPTLSPAPTLVLTLTVDVFDPSRER